MKDDSLSSFRTPMRLGQSVISTVGAIFLNGARRSPLALRWNQFARRGTLPRLATHRSMLAQHLIAKLRGIATLVWAWEIFRFGSTHIDEYG